MDDTGKRLSRRPVLAVAILVAVTMVWVFGPKSSQPAPRSLEGKARLGLEPPASYTSLSVSDQQQRASATDAAETPPRPESPLEALGLFPRTGECALLDDLQVKDLPRDLGYDDAVRACMAIKQLEGDLAQRILEDNAWLADTTMSRDEAEFHTAQGGLVLSGRHPSDRRQRVYINCPANHSDELSELRIAFQLIIGGSRYKQQVRDIALADAAKAHPGDVFFIIDRPEGGGFDVVNGGGETVLSHQPNTPGAVY
jgi:hypothetical protein